MSGEALILLSVVTKKRNVGGVLQIVTTGIGGNLSSFINISVIYTVCSTVSKAVLLKQPILDDFCKVLQLGLIFP